MKIVFDSHSEMSSFVNKLYLLHFMLPIAFYNKINNENLIVNHILGKIRYNWVIVQKVRKISHIFMLLF